MRNRAQLPKSLDSILWFKFFFALNFMIHVLTVIRPLIYL